MPPELLVEMDEEDVRLSVTEISLGMLGARGEEDSNGKRCSPLVAIADPFLVCSTDASSLVVAALIINISICKTGIHPKRTSFIELANAD